MPPIYKQFEEAREVRRETLKLVEGLGQEQSDFQPDRDTWAVGQVLDHILKLDALIVRELEVALNQRRRGIPFTYRGIADVDTTVPWILRPLLPWVEVPFGIFNAVVPLSVRNSLTGNRAIPLRAPAVLQPRSGRSIEDLRQDLGATFDQLERQQADDPDIDLETTYYYNPITGLSSIAGLYRFVSNHERRHQKQLRDILEAGSFPRAEKLDQPVTPS